jgi:hypothetical protein
MTMERSDLPAVGCRCSECADIHSEFISHTGKWPGMTHKEGQELKERRIDNERSWQRLNRTV